MAVERGVLVATLVAGVALLFAATGAPADPDRAEAVALGEIAARLTRGIRASWERGLAGEAPVPPTGPVFRWSGESPDPTLAVEAGPGDAAALSFDIDLLRSTRAELVDGDLEGARGWILTALDRPGIDPPRRGAAWLRGIQLALRAGDAEEARRYHREAWRALAGMEALEGTSLRLLIGLAIAPALEGAERAALAQELAAAWSRSELALPGPGAALRREGAAVLVHEVPEVVALRDALNDLAPGEVPIVPPVVEARAVGALGRELGGLPTPPAEGRWRVEPTRLGLLVVEREAGALEAFFVDPRACAETLAARARAEGVLPEGFRLAPTGESAEGIVAERIALVGNALVVDLVHPEPASLVATERTRAARTRLALLAAAAVIALAGAATFRALRRERLLQALRISFVAGVSHELRTPLASILLMAENLEEGKVAGEEAIHRYHGAIRSEALRLRRLIEDVLDFSRLERGLKIEHVAEEVELAAWLDELQQGWERSAARLSGRVEVTRDELPMTAAIDGDALRRALDNLVDNALKHGGGAVRIRVHRTDGCLVFEVGDRGPGIPPAKAERVFEAFVRLTPEDGGAAPGAGLGLAIVREIVDAHRGTIRVASTATQAGARLVLTVPLGEPDDDE